MSLNVYGGLANGFHGDCGDGETWLVVTYFDELKAGDQYYWHEGRDRPDAGKWIDIPPEAVGKIALQFWEYPPDSIRRHKDNDPFETRSR